MSKIVVTGVQFLIKTMNQNATKNLMQHVCYILKYVKTYILLNQGFIAAEALVEDGICGSVVSDVLKYLQYH